MTRRLNSLLETRRVLTRGLHTVFENSTTNDSSARLIVKHATQLTRQIRVVVVRRLQTITHKSRVHAGPESRVPKPHTRHVTRHTLRDGPVVIALNQFNRARRSSQCFAYLRRPSLLDIGVFCSLTLASVRPLSSKACMRDMSTFPSSLERPALCACNTLRARDLFSPSTCAT